MAAGSFLSIVLALCAGEDSHLSVVRLRSGEVVVGSVRREGTVVHVRTTPSAPESTYDEVDVLSEVPQGDVRRECSRLLAETPPGDVGRAKKLARMAAEAHLTNEAIAALDILLAAGPAGTQAEEARKTLAPLAREEAAAITGYGSVAKGKIAAALAPLEKTPSPARTLYAKLVLENAPSESVGPELVSRALRDPSPPLREAATATLVARNDVRGLGQVSRGVNSSATLTRLYAAEALGTIGTREAAVALVNRLATLRQGGGSVTAPRATFFSGVQQAYVADYDVDVAQASAIADPIIGVLQDGVVLDVRVLNVSHEVVVARERQVVRSSLAKIAGKDLGDEPDAWAGWLKGGAQSQPAGPRTPY